MMCICVSLYFSEYDLFQITAFRDAFLILQWQKIFLEDVFCKSFQDHSPIALNAECLKTRNFERNPEFLRHEKLLTNQATSQAHDKQNSPCLK